MRSLPEDVDLHDLIRALAAGWGFDAATIEYAAVGGGSYHWLVADPEGARGFVTVDDLDRKPWLGDTPESAFGGLRQAFDTAAALRESGLAFVLAPAPARSGAIVHRLGPRHAVALFPFVDGRPGRFGEYEPDGRAALLALLPELHRATPAVEHVARRLELGLPGRAGLEAALRAAAEPWTGGPYAEPARQALAHHASDVIDLLALHDRLAAHVAAGTGRWVVTHGEPHGGNVMRTADGYVLVDWDTVALGPPERDLWMLLAATGDEAAAYAAATGHRPDAVALDFFRLTWDLADLASFTEVLRSPHQENADSAKSYNALMTCVAIRPTWEAQLARN